MGLGSFQEYELENTFVMPGETKKSPRTRKIDKRFLKAPLQWDWLCEASRLAGKALNTAIGLRFIAGLTNSTTIKMQGAVLKDLGVSRQGYSKGLSELEKAGLVRVERGPGQTPIVTLLEHGSE